VGPGPATIARVSERLELDDAALTFVASAGLIPGSAVTVQGRDGDVVLVETTTGAQRVPADLAGLLFVAA
jgi:hypothetical protein